MHEVLVNRLEGLSLPRKSVVMLTDRPDMTLDVYRGRKTTIQQQQPTRNQIQNLLSNLQSYGHFTMQYYKEPSQEIHIFHKIFAKNITSSISGPSCSTNR